MRHIMGVVSFYEIAFLGKPDHVCQQFYFALPIAASDSAARGLAREIANTRLFLHPRS